MSSKVGSPKLLIISFFAIVFSSLTIVLGSPLLRVLRKSFGPTIYWLIGFLTTGAFVLLAIYPTATILCAVWITSGVYMELEEQGSSWWTAGVMAILSGAMTVVSVIFYYAKKTNSLNLEVINTYAADVTKQMQQINPEIQFDAQALIMQAPSLLLIILIFALGAGLIFEKKIFTLFKIQRERIATQVKLLEIKVPDFFIFIPLFSALFVLVDFKIPGQKAVAMNVLNISLALYFLQGVAIIEVLLRAVRSGVFTRVLTYLLLVGQMFVVVSMLGFIDYWFDFRFKIKRMLLRSSRIK